MHRFVIAWILLFSLKIPAQANEKTLPELNWEQRSDWLNVKKDVTPQAVGDGKADDTAAIQAALDKLPRRANGSKGVFLPAGTYRITKTLTNKIQNIAGIFIVGTGRNTKIVWDGPQDGVMFRSNGIHRYRVTGIIWDGRNKAAVGFDHRADKRYETRVRHQSEAFLNFTDTGIRVGYKQKVASAEMIYENLLFENCKKNGISFLAWNDYDNTITGCGFYKCGTAVNVVRGNIYLRDSHFEESSVADLNLTTHSHSVRRCTSLNSNMFITSPHGSSSQEVVVEDCRVSGWKDPDGAIVTRLRGPNLIFDTVFSNPPNNAPPIYLANGKHMQQLLIVSNNSYEGCAKQVNPGVKSRITEIPKGTMGGVIKGPEQTFLRDKWRIPGKVFDVTKFGGRPNDRGDDTAAIRAAIAAAAKHGNDAIAYLPTGYYIVSDTIVIKGAKYFVGGSGVSTIIQWRGKADGTVFKIENPQDIVLEHFQIKADNKILPALCMISQLGTKDGSKMTYDGVYVGGSWLKGIKSTRGLECVGLGPKDSVLMPHFDGSMKFVNCSNAEILVGVNYDGVLKVEGREPEKKSFVGILTRVCSGNAYDVIVKDSQNLVIGDFYTEQTKRYLNMSGNKGDTPGAVVIQGAKTGTENYDSFLIDNYRGLLFYGSAQFCYKSPIVTQKGQNPVDLMFVGNMFWDKDPVYKITGNGKLILIENVVVGKQKHSLANKYTPDDLKKAAAGLDYLRKLGRRDLKMNYPEVEVK